MKQLLFILSIAFCGCVDNNTTTEKTVNDTTIQTKIQDSVFTDSTLFTPTVAYRTLLVWHVDFDHKTKSKYPGFSNQSLNVDSLIKGLNEMHDSIQLVKVKIAGDTLVTQIPDSYYLGERIGSYGASAYIAVAIINLTSIKKLKFIKIDFEDGSHISPGVWSAEDFKEYKEIPWETRNRK